MGFDKEKYGKWRKVWRYPTLMWGSRKHAIADNLEFHAIHGIMLSLWLMLTGRGSMIIMFTLWAIYLSIANVGQVFYAFGWESQLLETGFLAIFLFHPWKVTHTFPVSVACILGYRSFLRQRMSSDK